LEKLGIPSALIGTNAFIDACSAMAKIGGIPEMRWALCTHPLGSLPEAELMVQARSAAEQFVDIVTGR